MSGVLNRAGWAWLWLAASAWTAARGAPPAEKLFPSSTKFYFAAEKFSTLDANWSRTPFADLFSDPAMQPFEKDLRRQIDEKWPMMKVRLGLSPAELGELTAGELAIAVVPDAAGKAALVALLDVTGHEPEAHAAIDRVSQQLVKRGGKRSQRKVAGVTLVAVKNAPPKGSASGVFAVYALHEGLLMAADDLAVAEAVVRRFAEPADGEPPDALADLPAFRAVMERCREGAAGLAPDARWFIEPLGLAATSEAPTRKRGRRKINYVEVLSNQGFDAVQGIGGHINFDVAPCALLHRTFAFAPPPYKLAMQMLVLPNGQDPSPPAWTPHNLAGYTSFHCDLLNAFDHVDTLIDELNNAKGLFDDTVASIKDDTQIDLRADLLAHLGRRVTVVTRNELPITPASQRRLLAFETTAPESLAATIAKSFEGDPRASRRKLGEHEIWEIEPEEDDNETDLPVVPLGARRASENPQPAKTKRKQATDEGPFVEPNSLIAVAHGHLFVTTDEALLAQALAAPDAAPSLADQADFRAALAECERLGAKRLCLLYFSRGGEQRQLAYELFRQGKLRVSESFLGTLLGVLSDDGTGHRDSLQTFDGGKLPPYDAVRRYFGVAGGFALSEPNGWFIVGFDLDNRPAAAAQE